MTSSASHGFIYLGILKLLWSIVRWHIKATHIDGLLDAPRVILRVFGKQTEDELPEVPAEVTV